MLLNDRADAAAVDATVARIQETLVAPATLDGRTVYITASVGITLLEEGDQRIEDVLSRADAAMYHAKGLGHARYAYFEDYMLNEAKRRLALSSSLRTAVDDGSVQRGLPADRTACRRRHRGFRGAGALAHAGR